MSDFVKKYPLILWFIAASAISAVITGLVIAEVVPAWVAFFATFGSSLTGVAFAAIIDGKAGLREMFGRLFIWRVHIGWWVVAVFALAPITIAGMALNHVLRVAPLELNEASVLIGVVPQLAMNTILAGIGEELGWRGFVLPRLQARQNALVSSIIIAFIWTLWHVPLFVYEIEGLPYYAIVQELGLAQALFGFFVYLTGWSILLTWVFNNTGGSLLLIAVFHGSQVWAEFLPTNIYNPSLYIPGITASIIVTALVVILVYGAENLSRTNERVRC